MNYRTQNYPIAEVVSLESVSVLENVGNISETEVGLRNFLMTHNWPNGLQDCMIRCISKIPIRYIICDDSGSMTSGDGKRVITASGSGKIRYNFLITILYHAYSHLHILIYTKECRLAPVGQNCHNPFVFKQI
jgi:hypothetical protein